ncbi:FAD-dependent oxidoreductase [bacterium]|nr:FAD-dependent oxidoreductase [bacterium]
MKPVTSPIVTTLTTDLLVIGGGVIGLSCALHIMETSPALRVSILDAPTNPGIASRAAAGMLAPLAEFEEESDLFRLSMESFDYYPEFLARFCPHGPRVEPRGLLIPASDASQARSRRIAEFASRFAEIEELSGAALHEAEPALHGGRCTAALRIPGGIVNPRLMHDALSAEFLRRGGSFIRQRLRAVEFEEATLTAVLLDDETRVEPVQALLATGAWSHHLGELFGLHLDVTPIKGQIARFDVPDGWLRHVVHEHHIYLAPRSGQGIVVGATMEDVGFSPSVDGGVNRDLHRLAVELAPGLRRIPISESWIGFRPRMGNGEPLMGLAQGRANLLVALGHFRNGILLAPVTGRRLAQAWTGLGDCSSGSIKTC